MTDEPRPQPDTLAELYDEVTIATLAQFAAWLNPDWTPDEAQAKATEFVDQRRAY